MFHFVFVLFCFVFFYSYFSLNHLVQAPRVVQQISWAETIWPEMLPEDCPYSKPQVSKYCLMGVKDSYTDFHADFGGTSVWYHVMRVSKTFDAYRIVCHTDFHVDLLYPGYILSKEKQESLKIYWENHELSRKLQDQCQTCLI